ncbi:MAG TPA: acyl carrier protein [Jatrophihabitans sp.]|nr:acyl carrier protein [Jatrophihabitans sp.]
MNTDASPETERQAFYDRVTAFIASLWQAEFRDEPMPRFTDDENLFDVGVLDSLSSVELIAWLEKQVGQQVDVLAIDPATFFTLRGLWKFASSSS